MRVIPDIRKEKLEDAQEILDKAKIKYKDEEEKEFSLKVRRGRVIRTEPEIGEKIKNDQEITIYVSRLWLLPIIILLLIMFLFMFTTIGLSNIKPSNTPKIAKKGDGWVKEELVYVVKDVDLERLDYYEYCISEKKNMKSCEWKATKTKNALVSETGEWYVQFRGVYQDKTKSRKSNKLKVYVDNDAPVVKKVTKETTDSKIHITMSATDKGSGINKYYYKVGDGEWKEADNDFTIKGLDPNKEYNITVKVEDKAGNEYTVEFKATTKDKDKDKDKDNNSQDNSNNNGNNENNNNNDNNANSDNNGDNNPNNPSDNNNGNNNNANDNNNNNNENENDNNNDNDNDDDDNNNDNPGTTPGGNTGTTPGGEGNKPGDNDNDNPGTTPGEEGNQPGDNDDNDDNGKEEDKDNEDDKDKDDDKEEEKLPTVDLVDVPVTFEYGSNYKLPSHYSYGTESGEVICALDHDWSVNYTSTEEIAVGTYTVTCKVTNDKGASATTEKQIKVTVPDHHEGDEEWDGWIKLNLYYPTRSTNREWRLGREDEIRDGEEDTGWQPYTGPILVRLKDVSNVYIRYDLDGETIVEGLNGKLVVDIEPDKMSLKEGQTTSVKIYYSKDAKTKEYRINGGEWKEYTDPFTVVGDTLIEARATRDEDVFDSEGNKILTRTESNKDAVYVSSEKEIYDYGTVKISIVADANRLAGNNKTKVNIYYEDDAETRYYKINNGEWKIYDGEFEVSKNTTIYAKATATRTITLESGIEKTGVATGSATRTINEEEFYVDVYGRTLIDNSEESQTYVYVQKNITKLEYKINDEDWKEKVVNRSGDFELEKVGVNTLVTVRATYKTESNDLYTVYDSLYVNENKNSLRINIGASRRELGSLDKANISISTNFKAETLEYRINGGDWQNYKGIFGVQKNTLVEAKATKTNTDGTTQTTYNSIYIGQIGLEIEIDANSYRLLKGRKTNVTLKSNLASAKMYYSFDNKNYTEYTSAFEVEAGTTIYAYAESQNPDETVERAYDIKTISILEVTEKIAGPVISENPTKLTDKATITITAPNENDTIYYSIDYNNFQEYTEPFEVTKNCEIRAYYVRGSDEMTSQTTYFSVQNIKVPQKPYVIINTKPSNYLSETVKMVEVSISGADYTGDIEYSFDNIQYQSYTGPFTVTQSCTIYARATNAVGTTTEKKTIVTKTAPKPLEKLNVSIFADPDSAKELIDKTTVTIIYDDKATAKYYRVGTGPLTPYTQPFEVTENTTIYAYAMSDNGQGEAEKQINFLTTGIAKPIISVSPTSPNNYVSVTIDYASTASEKKYKLDNGDWLDYTGPFEIIINETKITAYNKDTLGHEAESEKVIDNILPRDNLKLLDKGMYYLITLNYPQQSKKEDREYKWKKDGKWKKYDERGFVLIKPEYRDQVEKEIKEHGGFKVQDNNGNEVTLGESYDHYYFLDVPLSQLAENIYMRWDLTRPTTPKIIPNTTDWTNEVDVNILYDNNSTEKLYKIVKEKKEEDSPEIKSIYTESELQADESENLESEWLEYEKLLEIVDNNTTIYAKSINEVEVESAIASKKITNIDRANPIIESVNVIKKGSSAFTIKVTATDDASGIDTYTYSIKNKDGETNNKNEYTFSNLNSGTEYTINVTVKDKAGNLSDVYELKVTTADINDIAYALDVEDWAVEKNVTITYPEDEYKNYKKQYSINMSDEWLDYTQPIKVKENGTIIIARVVDGNNIKVAESFTVEKIDPTEPEISLDGLPEKVSFETDLSLPTNYKDGPSGSTIECKIDGYNENYKNASELPIGSHILTCTITTGAGNIASTSKQFESVASTIKGESILQILNDNENLKTGYYNFEITEDNTIYGVHMIILESDQEITENVYYGNSNDVAAANRYAQNMVIVKVKGNLTIDENVVVRPYYTEYGGPKGFLLYVTGKLENNGTIDNSHGAKAPGEDVYLWKNANPEEEQENYEYVPATGAVYVKSAGTNGVGRQTGSGGSGYSGTEKAGSGTSYSGGTGNGVGNGTSYSNEGGAGGAATNTNTNGGGAGNPGGVGRNSGQSGANGTGGLLIIYANEYENNGLISSNGAKGGNGTYGGGGSGGGSINIFTNQNTGIDQLGIITQTRYNEILGKTSVIPGIAGTGKGGNGQAGGNGTVNIGEIRNNTYYDLSQIIEQDKEEYKRKVSIKGESILKILQDNPNLESGYWQFEIEDKFYPVHLYVLEESQDWQNSNVKDENGNIETVYKTYGDEHDVATASDYAQNMVIVKVKGNLTIGENVVVRPYYTEYGGPKGFLLYVTGKLENNGTIDNSHGAKAPGEDVYLWKNANPEEEQENYEYVPATGAVYVKSAGTNGVGRQTGSGGSGYAGSGAGSGTSYSGGTGNGSGGQKTGYSNEGGAGGAATSGNKKGGGAGNPGGIGYSGAQPGANGTGGLLIIYANEYENNGLISSNGAKGGNGTYGGGGSGGGSINIFYSTNNIIQGITNVSGGGAGTGKDGNGQAGGKGTVTYTQINVSTISTYYTYPSLTINGFKAGYVADNAPQNAITPDDTLQKGSFDGKHETFSTIAANGNAMFTINNDVKDKSLIFDISQMSEDATISFYNKLDQELLTIKAISNKKINIPDGTTKVVINSGSEDMHLNEIELDKQDLSSPTITTSSIDWTTEKTIKITYPLGYKAEYSTDLGESWQDYTEQGIIINKPTTVIARVIDNSGKVLSASSMTITKIDDVEPTIELELNDIYEEGKDLAIPTKVEYGLSGGTSECKVNEQVITNIKDLTVGEYTITCTATSKVGKTKTVEKNIRITAKEVEEETTTTTIPVETSSTTTVVTSEVNNE